MCTKQPVGFLPRAQGKTAVRFLAGGGAEVGFSACAPTARCCHLQPIPFVVHLCNPQGDGSVLRLVKRAAVWGELGQSISWIDTPVTSTAKHAHCSCLLHVRPVDPVAWHPPLSLAVPPGL